MTKSDRVETGTPPLHFSVHLFIPPARHLLLSSPSHFSSLFSFFTSSLLPLFSLFLLSFLCSPLHFLSPSSLACADFPILHLFISASFFPLLISASSPLSLHPHLSLSPSLSIITSFPLSFNLSILISSLSLSPSYLLSVSVSPHTSPSLHLFISFFPRYLL